MKKLVYKSYKVFSYRFYSFVPININSVFAFDDVARIANLRKI